MRAKWRSSGCQGCGWHRPWCSVLTRAGLTEGSAGAHGRPLTMPVLPRDTSVDSKGSPAKGLRHRRASGAVCSGQRGNPLNLIRIVPA